MQKTGGKGIWWKKYRNETATRQIWDSITVSNLKARKINTPLSFPIHRPIVDLLPPPSSSLISWTRHLFSADASVVIFVVCVLIFLLRRLCCCFRFLGPVAYPPPPLLLSPIPRTRRIFLVLFRRLRRHRWVCGPVLLCQHLRRCCQYPDPINTPAPPRLETFTQTCCISCFLNWRLRCHR